MRERLCFITFLYLLPAPAQYIAVYSGSPQSLTTGVFQPLVAIVLDHYRGVPLAGIPVFFSSPSSGPSGSFEGSSTCFGISQCTSWQVNTDANGLAAAPPFAPNRIGGSYEVYADLGHNTAIFSLTNLYAQAEGQVNVGYFQPLTQTSLNGPTWLLDANGNGIWDATRGDKNFTFTGQSGSIPVIGDWNGDGTSKLGVYQNGVWMLDYNGNGVWDGPSGGDKLYNFGGADSNFVPVVGDWTGLGTTKIGFYSHGFWALDLNGNGTFDAGDAFYGYGGKGPGEVPLVGDWNGDKRDKIGFYINGEWALDANGDGISNAADYIYTSFPYLAGDKPVIGDWNGDKRTKIGVYRNGFWVLDYDGNGVFTTGTDKLYALGGTPGELPLVGDWAGAGRSSIGVYANGFFVLDFNGNGTWDGVTVPAVGGNYGLNTDRFIPFYGGPGTQPIIGKWKVN